MQMSSVDVFAVGGAGESDRWEEITTKKVIFIKMRQNHNFETWRIEGECFQESLIIPLNSTSSHSHLRQR